VLDQLIVHLKDQPRGVPTAAGVRIEDVGLGFHRIDDGSALFGGSALTEGNTGSRGDPR
jgi:hypothetical protein